MTHTRTCSSEMTMTRPVQVRTALKKLGKQIEVENIESRQNNWGAVYNDTLPHICLLRLYRKNKKVRAKKLTDEYRCREELSAAIINNMTRKVKYFVDGMPAVFMFRNADADRLKKGMRILNYFERKARWGLSFSVPTQQKNCTVVVGSGYWAESSLSISLYLLLLRVLARESPKKGELAEHYIARMAKGNTSDQHFLTTMARRHPNFLSIVMKHRRMLKNGVDVINHNRWDDYGMEGVDYLAEVAMMVCDIKSRFKGRAQSKKISNMLDGEGHYWDDDYDPDYDEMTVSVINKGLVLALSKLLTKYKGKKVTL